MIKDDKCVFCKIVEKSIPSKVIFENDKNLAFLDIFPVSKGHTIVIPKNHYKNLEDIPDNELSELFEIVKKVSILIRKKLQADGYNILQEDGKLKIFIPKSQAKEDELNQILRVING
jgi:histidine triad (HIT) family protein